MPSGRIRSTLPQDILDPTITRFTLAGSPVATYAIESDTLGEAELSWLIDDTIAKRLRSIVGVGSVDRQGGVDREVRVDLKPDRLLAFGINRRPNLVAVAQYAGRNKPVVWSTSATVSKACACSPPSTAPMRCVIFRLHSATVVSVRLAELGNVDDRFADRITTTLLDGRTGCRSAGTS